MNPNLPLSGLMNPPENDTLDKLKKEILGSDSPPKSIRLRLGELTPEDRASLVRLAKLILSFQRAKTADTGVTDIDYLSLIEALQKGLKPELKILLADVLDQIEPVVVVAKEKAKPTGMSLYQLERFFPKRDDLSNIE